jgi:MAP3K TRAFs-binding domain
MAAQGREDGSARQAPICFVLMPFGIKPDADGRSIDFDEVYELLLAPAVREVGLEPLRADQELIGGVIHKPMYERLVLAEYAVADLTTANPNVFYELGVRHAVRPYSTVLVNAENHDFPFDLAPDRFHAYSLDEEGGLEDPEADRRRLVNVLRAARGAVFDSPVFQLIDDFPVPEIDRLKTDTFRSEAAYSAAVRERLAVARREGTESVQAVMADLGPLEDVEAGVLVDLLISFRATEDWQRMIDLVEAMSEPIGRTKLVREQYGFALNRAGRSADAERVLEQVLDRYGASSETLGLLGRIYKDRFKAERKSSPLRAAGYLDKAITTYRRGFEADWRDAYPGINVLALMEVRDPGGDPLRAISPVVRSPTCGDWKSGAPTTGITPRSWSSRSSRRIARPPCARPRLHWRRSGSPGSRRAPPRTCR